MDIQFPDAIRGGKAGGGHTSIEQRNTHHKPGGWGEGRNSVPSIQFQFREAIFTGTVQGSFHLRRNYFPHQAARLPPRPAPLYLLASCEH